MSTAYVVLNDSSTQRLIEQRNDLLVAAKEALWVLEILTAGYKRENRPQVMQSLREAIKKAAA